MGYQRSAVSYQQERNEMRKQKFRQLVVWQRAMEFVADVYRATADFPRHEMYGLTSQLRRAAVSIAMNIAEGSGAGSDPEFGRFLLIASRSGYEAMCGIEVAVRLQYLPKESGDKLLDCAEEVCAMLHTLVKKLKADS